MQKKKITLGYAFVFFPFLFLFKHFIVHSEKDDAFSFFLAFFFFLVV
jgi:hypothetical protein